MIRKNNRILENPCNLVYEYIFHNPLYKPNINNFGFECVDIYIANVAKSKIIDIVHTGISKSYHLYLRGERNVDEKTIFKKFLEPKNYHLVCDEGQKVARYYEWYAIPGGIDYLPYALESHILSGIDGFTENRPFDYFK